MACFVNHEFYSKILELPYVKRDWSNYNLGGGYGPIHKEKSRRGTTFNFGRVVNATFDYESARNLFPSLNNCVKKKYKKCISFYMSVLLYCYEDIKDKLTFEKSEIGKYKVKIKKCCETLTFPDWSEEMLERVWMDRIDFHDYLDILVECPGLNFDITSAKTTYDMQGDKAIFGILIQIFTVFPQNKRVNIKLIPDIPVTYVPKVSDFVSGVFFPVVATKFSNKFHWKENDNGIFLIDEFGTAIDCVKSGTYSCGNDPLFNRLGFVYRSGNVGNPWFICWNWGELVEAVGYFGGDILVRGLSEGLVRSDWRRFGINGLLGVRCKNNRIYGAGRKKIKNDSSFVGNLEINHKNGNICVNLLCEPVDVPMEGNVVYNNHELEDWFELGQLCKEKIKK